MHLCNHYKQALLSSQVCSIMRIMKFQTQVKQVLGTPDQGAWSQVHHFIPDQKEKFQKRGELVLLVSLGEIEEDQPTASVGREIISRFHEEYYGDLEKKPMAALEEAARKVAKEKSQYFKHPEEISLIGLVLWKNIGYLIIYHQGKILLRRQSKTTTLLSPENGQPVSASGYIQTGDIFLLGTTDFFDKLPQTMIPSGLATEDLDKMVEIWAPVVHARENQGRLGAAVVEIGPEEKEPEFIQPEVKPDRPKKQKKLFSIKKPKIKLDFLKVFLKKISGLSLALGFLILLGVSIFFGWKKRKTHQREIKAAELSAQIEERISNANSIRNLDPEETINLINQAKEINAELEALDRSKAKAYLSRMDEVKESLGEKALKPRMYYDMDLVDENIEVSSVYTDGVEALVHDIGGRRLISLDLDSKSAQIVAGGEELSKPGLAVATQNRIYFVDGRKIYWVENEKMSELIELDSQLKPISAGGWLGNLYLLDSSQEEIWRFPSITDGIGRERPWFKSTAGLDFAKLSDLVIETNIWLLAETGEVYLYLSGNQQDLDFQLPTGIGKAVYLAVSQEADRISFWDEENKIVWLFSKQGVFLARQPVEIDNVRGIAVSPDGTVVYLFGLDKIYSVEFME